MPYGQDPTTPPDAEKPVPGGYGKDPTERPSATSQVAAAPPSSGVGGFFRSLLTGAVRGGRDVLEGGAQIGARMMAAGPEEGAGAFDVPEQRAAMPARVDEAVRQSAQAYEQDPVRRAHPIAAGIGRVGGNVAATAPLMAIPGMGLGGAAARSGAGLVARGALGGAAGGAMQPVTGGDYWTEKLKQAGTGALVGAAIPAVGSAISPRLPSARAVKDIPQDSGYLARAFRPLYNFFTGAEERTVNGFDRTIARQVLDPIGGEITGRPAGHELLRQTEQQISDVYDRVLPHIQLPKVAANKVDPELDNFVATMSSDHVRRYHELLDRNVERRFPANGIMDGTTFQQARSDLGKRARSWLGTNDDELGHAVLMKINHLQEAVSDSNQQFAPILNKANESWRLWARMRQAGSKASKSGEFSPDDLLQAIARQEKGWAWRGDRPLQGYAQAARAAMGKQATSLRDLAAIFHRHGIIGEVAGAVAGPLARGAKAVTPATAPGAGAFAARQNQTPQQRERQRLKAAGKVGELKTDHYQAIRRGDLAEAQALGTKLAAAHKEYRDLGGMA